MRKPPNEDWFGSIFTFCVWWGLIAGGIFGYAIANALSLQMPVLAVLLLLGGPVFGFIGGVWFADRIRDFIWRKPDEK